MRVVDQLHREVSVSPPVRRIVSLVPSQTELLHYFGLEEQVVGITRFCVHPQKWHQGKTRVGGTKKVKIDRIRALNPDLIIANKEENTQKDIEQLATEFPVWISDIRTIEDSYEMIHSLGELLQQKAKANQLIKQLQQNFSEIKALSISKKRVLYFIWKDPYMVAANNTFIHQVIQAIGWNNAVENSERYPQLTEEQIKSLNPELVLLSSEPYPFQHHHALSFQNWLPKSEVKIVDGEVFSWYGPRMLRLLPYLKKVLG